MRSGNVDVTMLRDLQANIRMLTGAGAVVTSTYGYRAFGRGVASTGATINEPFRYEGEFGYFRHASQQYYVVARWLDGNKGRWLSRDPIGFDGGWSSYKSAEIAL